MQQTCQKSDTRSGNVNAPSRPVYTYIICTIIMAIIEAGISNYFNEKKFWYQHYGIRIRDVKYPGLGDSETFETGLA